MPTMSKNLNDMPEISTMWQAARLALCKAKSVLLFGFSFPTSDELLVQMVRSCCNKTRGIERVASIDLNPEAVLERFEYCLPRDYDVETTSLPVVKNEVPVWYSAKRDAGRSRVS